jgi:hypothetical protein
MVTMNRYRNESDDQNLAWTAALAALLAGGVLVRWLAHASALVLAGLAAVVLVALLAAWVLFPPKKLPRNRVRDMRLRARLRMYPGRGHATVFELWLRWGRVAAARRARRSRPSLSLAQRLWQPSLTSVLVARAQYGHACRVPVEEHVIYIAPPRAGKTGALADVIVHHPGAVVATTTRGDLHALTARIRAVRGPVYVFNPQQLADVPSNMRWDMLAGCEDPATAIRRAAPLAAIAAYKGEGEDFWVSITALWLQTLLHVAALRGGSMDLVQYWALQRTPRDFFTAISGAGGEAERWGRLIQDQMISSASRTTDTIRYMIASNLGFMTDPVLRKAVTPGPGMFSPADFVREGGTLYLIAESRDERPSPVGGLFTALVIEIYHQATLAAAQMPGSRLDPTMLWALDEVTQTCPLPLPSLLADAGGRGIQIMPVVHGVAQLRSRWGADGARTILDACGTKVFLPGGSDPETLDMASRLSGTFAARERGAEFDTRHPVMTEDMIRQLPARRDGTGYAFVLRNGLSPVIGRPPVIWHDRSARRMARQVPQPVVRTAAALRPVGPALRAVTVGGAKDVGTPPAAPARGPVISDRPDDRRRPERNRRAWDQTGQQE